MRSPIARLVLLGTVLLTCSQCTAASRPSADRPTRALKAAERRPARQEPTGEGAAAATAKRKRDQVVQEKLSNVPAFYRVRTTERVVALTFDDGPDPGNTRDVLSLLARYHDHATFFVLGQSAKRYPGLVRVIAANGNEIASHGMRHVLLTRFDKDQMLSEITRAQGLLGDIAGQTPRFFRPPYGAFNRNVVDAADRVGQTLVLWTTDARDWTNSSATVIAARVLDPLGPGAIILLHDGGGPRRRTVQALEIILQGLRSRGYRAVTLQDLVQTGSPVPISQIPESPMPSRRSLQHGRRLRRMRREGGGQAGRHHLKRLQPYAAPQRRDPPVPQRDAACECTGVPRASLAHEHTALHPRRGGASGAAHGA